MISSKHITKITVVFVSLAMLLCVLGVTFSDRFTTDSGGYELEYENELFDTSKIIDIDISIDGEQWQALLDNAINEEYYKCDITVNGTKFDSVGIRAKGNTSLSNIANDPDNDRYSFKIEFDKFVEGQSCFGLDKLVLNNGYADTTNMKEAVVYDMFKFLGADASLYNYTKISINGEYWGVYLALEAVEDSFMLRNFGTERGYLYKPDNMNMSSKSAGNESDRIMKGGHRGGGADLNYTDDNTDSYSSIWDGEVNESGSAEHKRVVKALKNIHAGNELEKYLDVDNVLKYMAVHSFAVNDDSLSGSMAHNYYLYEYGGRLNIIPWDYNLSFGGMQGGDASSVINAPIDNYFNATEFFDCLFENEEYKARYYEYYNKLIDEYVFGGKFEENYSGICGLTDELVKTDPNYMYTYEEYVAGRDMLSRVVMLRAESVKGQLEGTIPSTEAEQRENPSGLTDSSEIDISVMGVMHGGGQPGEPPGGNGEAAGDMPNGGGNDERRNRGMRDGRVGGKMKKSADSGSE